MAARIVDLFGEETLDVIEQDSDQLLQVPGIGKKRIVGIRKAWHEQKAIKEVMIFLQSHGVSTSLATKIFKQYGDDSLQIVQQTPYKMVNDIHGIGFKSADKIAQALGLAHDDPGRIEAGIAYTLNQMSQQGHVYVPQEQLEPKAADILGVQPAQITAIIEALEGDEMIKREVLIPHPHLVTDPHPSNLPPIEPEPVPETAVYLTPLYYSEVGVANRINRLVHHPTSRVRTGRPTASFSAKEDNILSPEQQQSIEIALENKVAVLTGGPGTARRQPYVLYWIGSMR